MVLRVASWNIWSRFGDFRGRYPAIISTLRSASPDLVGLVEIWWDESENQIERLAAELGYEFWASSEIGLVDGAHWGVGVLSRLPITEQERLEFENPLPGQPPGVALLTSIDSDAGAFDFVCMCEWGLSWSPLGAEATSDRLESYRVLAARLAEHRRPLAPILVGDLNSVPEARDIRALTGKEPQLDLAMTFLDTWEYAQGIQGGWTIDGLANPHIRGYGFGKHRIDYVMTGAGDRFDGLWGVRSAEVFGQAQGGGEPPSDHYGVLAEIEAIAGVKPPSDDHVIGER